jgi:hypothetical protein
MERENPWTNNRRKRGYVEGAGTQTIQSLTVITSSAQLQMALPLHDPAFHLEGEHNPMVVVAIASQ